MYKRILIALIVITVLAVGAYTVFVFATRSTDETANSENANLQANVNSKRAAPIVSGDRAVNKSITYRDVTFEFETALATTAYSGQSAEPGKQFIVVFLKPFQEALTTDPMSWVGTEVTLAPTTADGRTFVPYEISMSTAVGQRGGYFSFSVPDDLKDFSMVFGKGSSMQSFTFSV